jgi:hypothetical protein
MDAKLVFFTVCVIASVLTCRAARLEDRLSPLLPEQSLDSGDMGTSSEMRSANDHEILAELRSTLSARLAYLNEFEEQMQQVLGNRKLEGSKHKLPGQKRAGISRGRNGPKLQKF